MGNVLTTVYTIDFLSDTWIRNTLITFLLMIFYLFISLKISEKNIFTFLKISSLTVIAMTLSNHILLASTGSWELQKHLPFHLCSISAIICCIIFFVKKNQFLFEFLFYAGILGGIFSILTPQITLYNENYFFYIMFYFKHAVIIIIPIIMMVRLKMNLSKYSGLKIFGAVNVLLIIIMKINSSIGSNYFYVASPPEVNNPLIVISDKTIIGLPEHVFYWEIVLIILVSALYFIFKKR